MSNTPRHLEGQEGDIAVATVYDRVLAILFLNEGGLLTAEEAKRMGDAGGETRYGITQATLDAHGIRKRARDVTKPWARAFYWENYWEPIRETCRVTPALALVLMDSSVQHGSVLTRRALQFMVGTKVDADIGPKTMQAIRCHGTIPTLVAVQAWRRDLTCRWVLRELDEDPGEGRDELLVGIIHRIDRMLQTSLQWLASTEDGGRCKLQQLMGGYRERL